MQRNGTPANREGYACQARETLRALEHDLAALRGCVEALGVLADRAADGPRSRDGVTDAGMGGDFPPDALIWAVRDLQTRVDAIDAKIATS